MSKLVWSPMDSSNIFRVAYDSKARELHVRFKSNPSVVYTYEGVGSANATDFINAASPGGFYSKYIKDKYGFRKSAFEEDE